MTYGLNWTPDQDAFLRKNWPRLSASQIARHVGKTKNAVIGRVGRIGLVERKAALRQKYKAPWTPGDPIPEHLRLIFVDNP